MAVFSGADELIAALLERDFDAVLVALPADADRLTYILSRARVAAPDLPVVVAAPARREAEAEAGAAAGAADYWLDAMGPRRLRFALEREAHRRRGGALRRARDEAFDRVEDAVAVADDEHRIVSWNRAAERMSGRRSEEVVGCAVAEVLEPLWRDAGARLKAWRAVAARGVWLGEAQLTRRDGSSTRISAEIAVARDGRGRRSGLLFIARPTAAPAAATSVGARQFFERILNAIADPVFVKNRGHRILFANDAFCALLARSREEILANDENQYLPSEQAAVFRRQDDLVFESGRENVHQETVTDARGLPHVLITKKTVWHDTDGRPYLVAVIREITELVKAVDDLKRSQETLRRAQNLETVGRMAGGVAHDFNNVLTAISGCAAAALEALPHDHSAREEVLEIRRAGERAAELTRQLLSFVRRPKGAPQVLDLREVYGGMRKMLERLLPGQTSLEFRAPDQLGSVNVDPGRAEQILLNLVVNAGDAMPGGGRVVVELEDVAAGPPGLPGPCVSLTVADSGVGMDESTRASIFEPFFTTKPQGTGLGLATVRDAVVDSGGVVVVESAPDRGSVFRVFWPLCARKAGARSDKRPARAQCTVHRARVLVVEDDEAVRRFVVRTLEHAGHTVLSAPDGLSALRLCRARKASFDAAVVDVILPRLLGPEFVERLREYQPEARILYVSGQLSDPVVQSCVAAGSGSFLPKPFDAALLVERVRGLLAAGGPGSGT